MLAHKSTHGYINPFRLRINTPWCPVCLVYFHSTKRVIAHMRSFVICGHNVMVTPPHVDLDADGETAVGHLGKADPSAKGLNCVAMVGPKFPVVGRDGVVIHSKTHPLGAKRRRHLPSSASRPDYDLDTSCPASFFKLCTLKCVLCPRFRSSNSSSMAAPLIPFVV